MGDGTTVAEHHFKVAVAEAVGVNAAIILEMLNFWVDNNAANERNFRDGRYWTYNTTKAFKRIYPYLSEKAIRTALGKLREGGYILVGDYNEDRYKRPNWYTITDVGYQLLNGACLPKEQDVIPKRATRESEKGEADTYIYSSSSTSSPSNNSSAHSKKDEWAEQRKEIIDHLNERVGSHYTLRNKEANRLMNARLSEGFTVDDFKTVIDKKSAAWLGTEQSTFLRPSTLFAQCHFEEYLNEIPKKGGKSRDLSEWDRYF